MSTLSARIAAAEADGLLSAAAAANVQALLSRPDVAGWEEASIAELAEAGAWTELDDRFYTQLKFGTGGLRGRTIGRVVAASERGGAADGSRPEHPAVGTNCLNDRAVAEATRGLLRYLRTAVGDRPRVVVSFDTRHFSPEFARTTAETAAALGAEVFLYEAPASTPQLAFTVRARQAHAGVMITASHNPPHDNGYKIYLADGSQIVEPAASQIAAAMGAGDRDPDAAGVRRGDVHLLDADEDAAFTEAVEVECLIDREGSASARAVRIVYSPLHGTGVRIIPRLLQRPGVDLHLVEEQVTADGAFPTVPSPNPEDTRVYERAIALAREVEADVIITTDPDADRLGIAVRNAEGDYTLLSGNQVGALLADHRLTRLFATGVLSTENAARAAVVKTYVTTDLIQEIARGHGVRCVETLTGFKYIGAKLRRYAAEAEPGADGLHPLSRDQALARSTYLVLGCEESFGYLAGDYVRDKDANGAAVMLAELVTHLASRDTMVLAYLDELYLRYGYYTERLMTLPFEGQRGAAERAALLDSYRRTPPREIAGVSVADVQDFSTQRIVDADGEAAPAELMLRFALADGSRVTVRGSGTEPKLKYYLALRGEVADPNALAERKRALDARLDALWSELRDDVSARLAAGATG